MNLTLQPFSAKEYSYWKFYFPSVLELCTCTMERSPKCQSTRIRNYIAVFVYSRINFDKGKGIAILRGTWENFSVCIDITGTSAMPVILRVQFNAVILHIN